MQSFFTKLAALGSFQTPRLYLQIRKEAKFISGLEFSTLLLVPQLVAGQLFASVFIKANVTLRSTRSLTDCHFF